MKKSVWGFWDLLDKRSTYLWGIGVGLIISWVTSGIAYLKGQQPATLYALILLELILSVIFILTAYFINTEKKKSK
jgi:apolipoprotein N-acyltransferase